MDMKQLISENLEQTYPLRVDNRGIYETPYYSLKIKTISEEVYARANWKPSAMCGNDRGWVFFKTEPSEVRIGLTVFTDADSEEFVDFQFDEEEAKQFIKELIDWNIENEYSIKAHSVSLLQGEIELAEDEGCIVFDFGCYFPYPGEQDRLNFSFSLGMTEFDDYKVNRRYPNKGYMTITRKYGRKLSKIGYPYVIKLSDYKEDEEQLFLLCIKIGVDGEEPLQLVFPVQTELTKEKPVCKLDFRFRFDKGEFSFESSARINGQQFTRMWLNYEPEYLQERNMEIYYFTPPAGEKPMAIYGELIEPLAAAVENLYLWL